MGAVGALDSTERAGRPQRRPGMSRQAAAPSTVGQAMACRDNIADGGVWAPGGLRRLQSGWDGRSPSGGFDSRPPPPIDPCSQGPFSLGDWPCGHILVTVDVIERRRSSPAIGSGIAFEMRVYDTDRKCRSRLGHRRAEEWILGERYSVACRRHDAPSERERLASSCSHNASC